MLSDIEKIIYYMVGNNSTELDGYLIINSNAETILTEKTLLKKFLETVSNYYEEEYKIVQESEFGKEYILVTNLPYYIYQKELGEYRIQFENQFDSKA